MLTQVRISDYGLLFNSFSSAFDFVGYVNGPTLSDELFTFFMDVVIVFVFFFGIDHRIDVDKTF